MNNKLEKCKLDKFWGVGSANLQLAAAVTNIPETELFLSGLIQFIVTHYSTRMQSHMRAHTHSNTLRPMSLLWSFFLSKQDATHFVRRLWSKWRVHLHGLNSWQITQVPLTNMHSLFIYTVIIYKSAKPKPFPSSSSCPSGLCDSAGVQMAIEVSGSSSAPPQS